MRNKILFTAPESNIYKCHAFTCRYHQRTKTRINMSVNFGKKLSNKTNMVGSFGDILLAELLDTISPRNPFDKNNYSHN